MQARNEEHQSVGDAINAQMSAVESTAAPGKITREEAEKATIKFIEELERLGKVPACFLHPNRKMRRSKQYAQWLNQVRGQVAMQLLKGAENGKLGAATPSR